MKKMSLKSHWQGLYRKKFSTRLQTLIFWSRQHHEYFDLIKKRMNGSEQTIFEIGCAPGTYLIHAAKYLGLKPCGVDYVETGKITTDNALKVLNISAHIYLNDVFDPQFLKEHYEKYDVVFSNGFLEHFDNPEQVLKIHASLAKPGGLIVISIPNLKGVNKLFTPNYLLKIHNLKVMNLKHLKKSLPPSLKLLCCRYYGGIFNVGLFYYKNPLLETLRKLMFAVQKFILEPIGILFYSLGINSSNSFTSPAIVLIAQKPEKAHSQQ